MANGAPPPGTRVYKNSRIVVDGVDLSDYATTVEFQYNVDAVEATTIGTDTRVRLAGLIDWSIDVTFNQSFEEDAVDQTLFDIMGGEAVEIEVTPDKNQSVSDTNPIFTGFAVPTTYNPTGGTVGEIEETTVSFQSSGPLQRLTEEPAT